MSPGAGEDPPIIALKGGDVEDENRFCDREVGFSSYRFEENGDEGEW